jgi:hypothetical protein
MPAPIQRAFALFVAERSIISRFHGNSYDAILAKNVFCIAVLLKNGVIGKLAKNRSTRTGKQFP